MTAPDPVTGEGFVTLSDGTTSLAGSPAHLADRETSPWYYDDDEPPTEPFVCAECGTTTAATYVVTGAVDDREGRTEVCLPCHEKVAPVDDEQPDREPSPEQERAWDLREDDARGHTMTTYVYGSGPLG